LIQPAANDSTTNRSDGVAQDEKVLVVERKVFDELGAFNGLAFDVERYLERLFAVGAPRFMPRAEAEKDPTHKQLIPYVLMVCAGKCLTYVRGKRAGETRLVGNRSIGIGGHINPVDDAAPLFNVDYREVYEAAVQREVEEEVNVETSHSDRIVALLNDDTNEVGQVHLGVVHLWSLKTPSVTKREQMITQMEFMDLDELARVRDTMETWSQLCLDGLPQMMRRLASKPRRRIVDVPASGRSEVDTQPST
jgi:predicted NUDIX family phosphoesterase